jgi:hypothetical protein
MYGNFIKETTSTAGTGTITLSAVSSYERFGTVFANNDPCFYSIQDGANREFGIGTWQTGNLLARTTVLETWVAGVRTIVSPTAISLSGSGVFVTNDVGFQYLPNPRLGPSVSSAATTNIWGKNGDVVQVTGTATISSFGTADHIGMMRWVQFTGAATIFTVAGNISVPNGTITLAAGTWCLIYADSLTHSTVLSAWDTNGNNPFNPFLATYSGGTMGASFGMGAFYITGVGAINYFAEQNLGNSGTALTIPLTQQYSTVTLNTATPVLTLSTPAGVGEFQLRVSQDGTGGRVPSFAGTAYSSSRWIGSPTQPAFNNSGDTLVRFFYNGSILIQRADKVGTA